MAEPNPVAAYGGGGSGKPFPAQGTRRLEDLHFLGSMATDKIPALVWAFVLTHWAWVSATVFCSLWLIPWLRRRLARRMSSGVPLAIFSMALSCGLLYYVGIGEALRGYPALQLEKLSAQGETVRLSMETFLRAGVPLKQFVGFNSMTGSLLDSDATLSHILVFDTRSELVFANSQSENADPLEFLPGELFEPRARSFPRGDGLGSAHGQPTNGRYYWVALPLSNKFEKVGHLILTLPRSAVSQEINAMFSRLARHLGLLMLLFVILLLTAGRSLPGFFLAITHGCGFLIASAMVILTLSDIFTHGIQDKAKALSVSIGKRLEAALDLEIPLSAFSGIDQTFNDYKELNPEIHAVSLTDNNKILIHNDASRVGTDWDHHPNLVEYNTPLGVNPEMTPTPYQVSVSIPRSFVYWKLWRGIKNFLTLFVAIAFLSFLFHTLAVTLGTRNRHTPGQGLVWEKTSPETKLALIKTLYFFMVFCEGLFSSFLPQYFQQIATQNGMPANAASWLFTAYFAAFALILIPAGGYADKHGIKGMMVLGVFLSSLSILLMVWVGELRSLLSLRALAGMGQGMLFIGVQSFILRVSGEGRITRGISIIVFGYNSGMISGTAIGALLVTYLGSGRVFSLGALIGLLLLGFLVFFIPEPVRKTSGPTASKPSRWPRRWGVLFRDLAFLKTIVLVGITTKATLTGIVIYALPLVMDRLGYPRDDIGQILIFYGGGVLISNLFIPRLADRVGKIRQILFWGIMGSGLGVTLMGFVESESAGFAMFPYLTTIVLILGVLLLGLSHGLIHAPIVTQIAQTPSAHGLGKETTTSIYRFWERSGHALGPFLIGQILVWQHYSAKAFTYIGLSLVAIGVIFAALRGIAEKPAAREGEP